MVFEQKDAKNTKGFDGFFEDVLGSGEGVRVQEKRPDPLSEYVGDVGEVGVNIGPEQEEVEQTTCGEHGAEGGLAPEDGFGIPVLLFSGSQILNE